MRDIHIPQDMIQIKMRVLVFSFTMNEDKKILHAELVLSLTVPSKIEYHLIYSVIPKLSIQTK